MLKNNSLGIEAKKKFKFADVVYFVAPILAGFLLAQSTLGGISSPLVASLVGALPLLGGFCVSIGALLAYFLTGTISSGAVEIGALVIIMAVKVIVCDLMGREVKIFGKTVLSGLSELTSGLVFSFLATLSAGGIFIVVCRSVLCAAATYFITVTVNTAKNEKHLVTTGTKGGALGMVFMLATAALCSVSVEIFSLGRAFAVFAILIAAKRWKHSGGAVCGILALCGITLFSADVGHASMMLPMAGIIAGLFSSFGTAMTVIFFIAANAVGMVLIGVSPETARISIDVIFGSVAFILVPENNLTKIFGSDGLSTVSRFVVEQVSSRLNFAAQSVCEVRRDVQKISSALTKKNKNNDIAVKTCDKVCRTCKNNMECWEKNFDRTFDGFEKLKNILGETMRISPKEFPAELEYCIQKQELARTFADVYKERIFDEKTEEKLSAMRNILDEQFISMEELLNDTAEQITGETAIEEQLSEEVKSFISDFGGKIVKGNVYRDKNGILKIEAFYSGNFSLDEKEIAEELSDIAGVRISNPQITCANGIYKLTAIESPHLAAEYSVKQQNGNTDYSGDTYDVFDDGKGTRYFIIADGMGSGRLAAVDSKIAVNFLKRLITGGVGIETAVRMINSSVRVKSNDESFSTLDVLKLNMYNGEAEFIKLGAAPSFIRTNGRVLFLEEKTFPVGIMHDVTISRNKFNLTNGDVVVMMSDGIESDIYPHIKSKLSVKDSIELNCLTEELIQTINKKERNDHCDDITIMTINIAKENMINKNKINKKILK